ncbi:MAG TPA: hypothetical protein VMP89_07055, partial [Solirubrobacteraceae bacterium]|nr:hypothetical protein [Solirubrobacteraceae bacterium]
DDRMWFAGTGSAKGGNLHLYQDYDVVGGSASTGGGNALVETESTDGTTFQPVVNTNPSTDCLGAAVHDCVTGNEGISGNQVVDPATGNVFIAHTTSEGSGGTPGVRVSEGRITQGTPPTATWSESPNLDGALCPDSTASSDGSKTCVDSSGNAEEAAGENFASIARDSAGYLYVTFTAGPLDHASSNDPNFGGYTAPEQIYVVHSLEPATMSDPSKVTWSAPQAVTGSGTSGGTNTFPWIVAGSDGRVDVAYYHTAEVSEPGTCIGSGSGTCTLYGAGEFTKAEWSVQMAQSLNSHDASPSYSTADVSENYMKNGQICTNGIGCSTGGDRSLGDFLQVTIDNQGAALVSYVDDTSADTSAGENAGPEVISRQLSGPSLLASVGTVSQGSGPGTPMGSVTDPTGDAYYSANNSRTPAGDNLDLTGASLANGPNQTLVAKIDVKDLSSLAVSPSLGGPDASWIIRWSVVNPGTTGNGHIYYAGMDNEQGAGGSGTPSFFAGDTAGIPPANQGEHTKYLAYPQTHPLSSSQASYDPKTGVITMNIPLSEVGSPPAGTVLYSATAFSATSTAPQSSTTLFNLTDAATPFELVIGAPGTVGTAPAGPPPLPKSFYGNRPGCPTARGKLTTTGIGPLSLQMTRARARQILTHSSTRGRVVWDFFCLKPIGIRAAYPSAALLGRLPRKQRARYQNRIVLLSTSDRLYALRGVHPGTRLSKVARKLKVGKPIKIGLNSWYLAPNGGPSIAVLKVRHGIIQEIGIAEKRFSYTSKVGRKFLGELP